VVCVCKSDSVSVTRLHPGKWTNGSIASSLLFGVKMRSWGPKNIVLDGRPDPPTTMGENEKMLPVCIILFVCLCVCVRL